MLSVQQFLEGFLKRWETAKHSLDPDDSGNYFKASLVGSKYGVTGAALAKHRGVASVSKEDVASVTLSEAAQVARVTYFDEANFDLLPWGPVVASAVDKCYMSGEDAAVKCLQRAAGTQDDGVIGKNTVLAVAKAGLDQEAFAQRMAMQREIHEGRVIAAKPVKAKYRNGWNNRSKSYLPGTSWWKTWNLDEVLLDTPLADTTNTHGPQTTAEANIAEYVRTKEIIASDTLQTGSNLAKEVSAAKDLTRNDVNDVLKQAPATVAEQVVTSTKLRLGEKSTWIGAALVVGSALTDPTVQAAGKVVISAIGAGSGFGILSALIGLGMVVAKSKATPRTDAVIAAKRLLEGAR